MKVKNIRLQFCGLAILLFGLLFAAGIQTKTMGQTRDPFAPNPAKSPRASSSSSAPGSTGKTSGGNTTPVKKGPPPIVPVGVPNIEQRIEFYKRMRENAALNGEPLPKVTSVLVLDEMSVTGIFKTPRGYAAMVEAKPIQLSYTIYPGEKFFDGQLVAVEENRLVFRKVTKLSNGKFTTAVENKALRQYSIQEEVRGTAPVEPSGRTETAENTGEQSPQPSSEGTTTTVTNINTTPIIISPVDEMIRQPAEKPAETKENEKNKKGSKRAKTAKNSKN